MITTKTKKLGWFDKERIACAVAALGPNPPTMRIRGVQTQIVVMERSRAVEISTMYAAHPECAALCAMVAAQ